MNKYRLLKMNSRGGRYYAEEIETGLRTSLKTANRQEAEKMLHAKNEAHRNLHLNQLMGQTYLAGIDPLALTRTWQTVFDAIIDSKVDGSDTNYLCIVRSSDRATEFKQRCEGLGITGVTLHSYRYGWAERARKAHYPIRCAQENLGQQSAAVHRAYAKNAAVINPSLDEWEELVAN